MSLVIPALGIFYGALAQSVEHLTFNQVVRGSNPRCFIKKRDLNSFYEFRSFFISPSSEERRYASGNVFEFLENSHGMDIFFC